MPPSLSDPDLATLQLEVELDHTDLWGAIEWTLATARRTGLMLGHLNLAAADLPDTHVRLRLHVSALEPSLLPLFVKRLENGIDVHQIRTLQFTGDAG